MDDVLGGLALLFVAAAATAAVLNRDPARQALVLSLLGLGLAVLFTVLQAPDVGLSQLAVGSAITPLMILLTVRKVRRIGRGRQAEDDGKGRSR
ncbi:Na(+)/H(+) antiporter subunit B [Streptomyces huiliensis]|uniref:Na(+)/H(+) antiporter subunit B n=1 Tax=Streptomyces huiliensis TaxID=2876027 RepID=UPI001CC16A13|nr:hydrogenase subunit MbhD domain-containing protein [Streptomyces huiliensis]MBZ4319250.1 DUF4040 domain-containing protein [Streptomyces huiliensis]